MLNAPAFSESQSMSDTDIASFRPKSDFVRVMQERGYIREGYWADLTLINPQASTTVARKNVLYKCGWSPVEGITFPARVEATWVNGELAYRDGKVLPRTLGQRMQFA